MKDKLSKLITMGAIHANTPASFAGPGGSMFNNPLPDSPAATAAPLDANGNQVVSHPVNSPSNPDQSKVVPGQNSTSSNDPTKVPKEGESPLDPYEKLFDNTPEVDAEGKPIDNTPAPTILDATAKDFGDAAAKMDFTKNVTEEQLAAVTDEEGKVDAGGLLALIQSVGQSTYAAALHTATGITKQGVDIANNASNSAAQDLVVQNQINDLVLKKNPNLGHAAFKTPMQQVMAQVIKKNPGKTAEEVADLTVGWFNHAAVQQQDNNSPTDKEAKVQKAIGDSMEAFWDSQYLILTLMILEGVLHAILRYSGCAC